MKDEMLYHNSFDNMVYNEFLSVLDKKNTAIKASSLMVVVLSKIYENLPFKSLVIVTFTAYFLKRPILPEAL